MFSFASAEPRVKGRMLDNVKGGNLLSLAMGLACGGPVVSVTTKPTTHFLLATSKLLTGITRKGFFKFWQVHARRSDGHFAEDSYSTN